MSKLKPCPFCGGKAYIDVFGDKEFITAIHKKNCIIQPDTYLCSVGIRKQINAWNRRADNERN